MIVCEWVLALILIAVPALKIEQFINQEISAEISASKPMLSFTANVSDPVVEILTNIDNNRMTEAIGQIAVLKTDPSVPRNLYNYFFEFGGYYWNKRNLKNKNEQAVSSYETVDALYFVKNSLYLVNYLQEKNFTAMESYRCAEIIPFYCIKYYEQFEKGNAVLYSTYISYLCEPVQHLSEYGASLCCMNIFEMYRSGKKNNLAFLQITEQISRYKEKYERELGQNAIFTQQSLYLETVRNFCNRKRKNFMGITWDSFPKYVME